MKLIKCFLNQVAYHYFPKDIHRSDPRFVATEENINYLKINSDWETLIKEILPFVEQLKSSLNIDNLILNGAPIGALAYQIEIPLRYNLDTRKVITIYISLLIPFYHIIKLQDNFNNKIISSYDIPKRIDKVVATLMNKNLGYQKFPKDLLEIGIPRIKLEDNFTHLNAFFTDFYRICNY